MQESAKEPSLVRTWWHPLQRPIALVRTWLHPVQRPIAPPWRHRRRPPPKRGPPLLPDSLIARASFTHGFPYYPNPNLPMALRPVVNRCANSTRRIDRLFSLDKGFEIEFPLHNRAVLTYP